MVGPVFGKINGLMAVKLFRLSGKEVLKPAETILVPLSNLSLTDILN